MPTALNSPLYSVFKSMMNSEWHKEEQNSSSNIN